MWLQQCRRLDFESASLASELQRELLLPAASFPLASRICGAIRTLHCKSNTRESNTERLEQLFTAYQLITNLPARRDPRQPLPPNMPAQSFQSIVSKIIPPLLSSFHKGQAGRVVVIGGCEDYTGAPYFAAHAATSLGCDMSHIICEKSAGQIIKTYSPNLMVHPYLYDSRTIPDGVTEDSVVERAASILDRVHAVVIGPGLGRDPLLLSLTEKIIAEVKKRSLPLVIDADGLYLIQSKPEIITGYKNAVLTPNVVELKRLFKSVESVSVKSEKHEPAVAILARKFGGVTVISKGEIDGISNGKDTVECRAQGGRKRVSGQGDTLSGCLGTFLAWRAAYHQGLWTTPELNESYTLLLAAYGASEVTRTSSYLAFEKKGRSTLTSDIGEQVGAAYTQLYASKVNRVK